MKRKKIKKLIALILLGTTLFGAGYLLKPIKHPQPTHSIKIENIQVDYSEVITESIANVQELLFEKTELYQSETILKGVQNNLFKNNKQVNFKAIGHLGVDFTNINPSNIVINNDFRTIKIYTTKPTIHIEFMEDKTTYQDDKGVLTNLVGAECEISPESMELAKSKVRVDMTSHMETKQIGLEYKVAESLQKLIKTTTGLHYDVTVVFVN